MELSEDAKFVDRVSEFVVAYDFEVYDIIGTITWFREHRIIMYTIVGLYLFSIFLGQKWMEHRPAYTLTRPLIFWNIGLALFSIICTLRGIPEALYNFSKPDGTFQVICVGLPHNYATSFWALLLVLSKVVEFGDTAFIILRKQKLIALHWFHHAATLWMCWIGYEYYETTGRAFFVNAFVHSFMYSYYALKAMKIKIPRKISQALTTLQIVQLTLGMYIASATMYFLAQGRPCRMHFETVCMGGIIIGVFLVLFVRFYIDSYSLKNKIKKI